MLVTGVQSLQALHRREQVCSKPIYPRSPKDYSGPRVKDLETFIQKAQFVHDNKYSYERSVYVESGQKITITCPIHGDFEQRSDAHLSGNGCPKCKFDSKRSNTETFIEQAKLVHGDTYGYERSEYVKNNTKLTINCKKHGNFNQQPASHLNGRGCPKCFCESLPGGYSDNKEEYKQQPAIFYHVKFTDKETGDSFEKIGITKNSVERRFSQITKNHELKLEVINEYPTTLYEAIEIEQEIKQYLNDNNLAYRVRTLKQHKIDGWTECFRCGDLDSII